MRVGTVPFGAGTAPLAQKLEQTLRVPLLACSAVPVCRGLIDCVQPFGRQTMNGWQSGVSLPRIKQKMRKRTKPYAQMNAKELATATAKFDQEFVIDESRELTPDEKTQWRRAKRKRGRPKMGQGVQIISVSIEKGLLKRADRLAKKLHTQRTRLIARGLEAILTAEAAADKSSTTRGK
jgi:hypothetical protein